MVAMETYLETIEDKDTVWLMRYTYQGEEWMLVVHGSSDGLEYLAENFVGTTTTADVQGDGAANGTIICSYTLAAASYFIITRLMAASNASCTIYLATGALGALTEIAPFYLPGPGSEQHYMEQKYAPVAVIDNSASSSTLAVILVAPLTGMGSGLNNDTNHYFHGLIRGLVIT